MELTPAQTDALTELINIGYGRAAAALSELTGHRIDLEVPKVTIHPIEAVAALLSQVVAGEVAAVNQVFSGPISGNALLMLDQNAASLLNEVLTDNKTLTKGLDSGAREVVTEVGNIVLNACLGVFGNLLQVQVSFSVPRLHVESVHRILRTITVGQDELKYGLMVHTRFHLRAGNIGGYLVIILGVTSLERLMSELQRWEQQQLQVN